MTMTKTHRYDDTFVITKNGYPYQVTADMNEYEALAAEYARRPERFNEESALEPCPPTPQEFALNEINRLEALQTPRLYREAIAGGEYAINKLAELDALIAALRAKL